MASKRIIGNTSRNRGKWEEEQFDAEQNKALIKEGACQNSFITAIIPSRKRLEKKEKYYFYLEQWFPSRADFAPGGHLVVSGDISDCRWYCWNLVGRSQGPFIYSIAFTIISSSVSMYPGR